MPLFSESGGLGGAVCRGCKAWHLDASAGTNCSQCAALSCFICLLFGAHWKVNESRKVDAFVSKNYTIVVTFYFFVLKKITVTQSVTWVASTSWPIMGSIQEHRANSRPTTMPRSSCPWWQERSTRMVGKPKEHLYILNQEIYFLYKFKTKFICNICFQGRFWLLEEA